MPTDREKERRAKLAKKPTRSAFAVDKEQQARQRAKEARAKKDNKPEKPSKSPTSDLSVRGAIRNLNTIKRRNQTTDSNN